MMKKTEFNSRGHLRRRLLDAAESIITEKGIDKLTLRALGRRVGVSRAAPYRHFKGKNDLLCAVAEEGFNRLRKIIQTIAQEKTIDPLSRFRQIAKSYVRFAVDNPACYRLMYSREILAESPAPSLRAAARAAFDVSGGVIEQCQSAGLLRAGDFTVLANIAWATNHGLSMLLLEDQIHSEADGHNIHSLLANTAEHNGGGGWHLVDVAIESMVDGLRPR